MSELDDIAATFGSSEPVYVVTLDNRGDLDFTVKNQYSPKRTDDPVQALLVEGWREWLDKSSGRFMVSVNIEGAYNRIVETVEQVMVNSSALKNPKQSRLYKWLQTPGRYNGPTSEGFIALYRYIMDNGIKENRNNTNPYAKNVIAILELMREKYEV